MIRHSLAEGWLLIRSRALVSLTLALALAVPLCLAGVTLMIQLWIQPLIALGHERSVVAVLLHPQMVGEQRDAWVAAQLKQHPEWQLNVVPREQLATRLGSWFPYLADFLEEEGAQLLPALLEVTTGDPASLDALIDSPAVMAIGPRSSVHHLLGRVAEKLGLILAALSMVLLLAATALAAIWVHLEVYRHADEITVMRLIGATEGAIRGPFLLAVTAPGLLAAVLSMVGAMVVVRSLSGVATAIGLAPVAVVPWILALQFSTALLLPLVAGMLTLAQHAYLELET